MGDNFWEQILGDKFWGTNFEGQILGHQFLGTNFWGQILGTHFWGHIFVDTFLGTNCSQLVVCVFLCVLGDVIHGYMEGKREVEWVMTT